MICFEIYVNGKYRVTAGIGKFGVLMAILHWVKRNPVNKPSGVSEKDWCKEDLFFSVSGGNRQSDMKWVSRHMKVGDEIAVKIVEQTRADKPKTRKRSMRPPNKSE